jgi:hypothetical protein
LTAAAAVACLASSACPESCAHFGSAGEY